MYVQVDETSWALQLAAIVSSFIGQYTLEIDHKLTLIFLLAVLPKFCLSWHVTLYC
jgi:hypothetical protein